MNTVIARQALKFLLAGSLAVGAVSPLTLLAAEHPKAQVVAKQVNINSADAKTIADVLVGIGTAKARAIVKFREEHGRFTNIDQLKQISGINQMLISNNRERIALE